MNDEVIIRLIAENLTGDPNITNNPLASHPNERLIYVQSEYNYPDKNYKITTMRGEHSYWRQARAAKRENLQFVKPEPDPNMMYMVRAIDADHCRYAVSPNSGSRYLVVGINPLRRGASDQIYVTDKKLAKHWTFRMRDFYTPPIKIGGHRKAPKFVIFRRYQHILTIKAENIVSIEKRNANEAE